jgi:hypothetical protein
LHENLFWGESLFVIKKMGDKNTCQLVANLHPISWWDKTKKAIPKDSL